MQNEVKELDQVVARKNKLPQYKEMGVDPYGHKFDVNFHAKELHEKYEYLSNEEVDEKTEVTIAGRIVLLRKMGKASFFNLRDKSGSIQCYIKMDVVGEENYKLFKLSDLGDIVGVSGHMMKTQNGTITLRVTKYTHLTKALRPLPDKFHGLSDIEIRSRKRYLDLIVNENSINLALTRPKIIRGIQHFLDDRGFVEVETPILTNLLSGGAARPFITHHNTLDQNFYMRVALELNLKRLLVGGMERVYEIGRCFRNEGMDQTHNPEFTMIEMYQAFGDLSSMMELVETLIKKLAKEVIGKDVITWNGNDIDLTKPFEKKSMVELVKQYSGVDFINVKSDEEAFELAKKHGIKVEKHFTFGHIVNAFFEKYVEENLIQPTFVCGHPIEISPLTKKDPQDPRFTQRFELFIGTKEFANAYTELNDSQDQKERFIHQLEEKASGNEEANDYDEDFVEALEYGLPPTGGMGIGIDRLCMFLTGTSSIREIILFPTLKNENK